MKFRTEIDIENSGRKIEMEGRIFSMGSCFSTEISELLKKGQLQTLNNPFGTIFNPYSIHKAVERLHESAFYTEDDLIVFDQKFISLDHSTFFDSAYSHKTLEKINTNIEAGNLFLQNANWAIITYGTSFVYEFLPKEKWVANCHKIPQKFFRKKLLNNEELVTSIQETILLLKDICPDNLQILFTVSPVRHTKDGMAENQLSKAKLIAALHEVIDELDYCHYLPAYEIMMDDLRDYRFYKEDMIHPSEQAVNYIFEKFGKVYFSGDTQEFIAENFKISQALQHRFAEENSEQYLNFQEKLQQRISEQQKKVKHKIFS